MTKKTVFRVYTASVEIPYTPVKGGWEPPEITEETARNALTESAYKASLEGQFDTLDEASAFLLKRFPEMSISGPMGMAVKYMLVSGAFVDSYDLTFDDEGDEVDADFIGTEAYSRFPEEEAE